MRPKMHSFLFLVVNPGEQLAVAIDKQKPGTIVFSSVILLLHLG